MLLVVSAAGRGRVLIKEPLHTGLMQPDSLIFLSTENSGCVTGRVRVAPKRPRELRETSFQTFSGVVYLAREQPPPLRIQTRLFPPSGLTIPPQVLAWDCPPTAPPASVVSPVPSPFTPRLPSHWPPLSASPTFVLALFTSHTHTSSCRWPLLDSAPREDAVVSSPRIHSYK